MRTTMEVSRTDEHGTHTAKLEVVTLSQLLLMFDESVHGHILHMLDSQNVKFMVVFENHQMDSFNLGERSAVVVGPGFTYQTPDDVAGRWLKDLPSQRQYPTYIYVKETEQ